MAASPTNNIARLGCAVVLGAGIVAFLAGASFVTTSAHWIGGWGPGEIRILVRDTGGNPVPGATLQVSFMDADTPAFDRFFQPGQDNRPRTSDQSGRLVLVARDFRDGGHRWQLFWVIPMGHRPINPDCVLVAPGYFPERFTMSRLYRSPHRYYHEFSKSEENGLKIYEQTFILRK